MTGFWRAVGYKFPSSPQELEAYELADSIAKVVLQQIPVVYLFQYQATGEVEKPLSH